MLIAIYARVSSEKQAENDLSIAAQLKTLRDYAGKKGWQVYKEFVDEAESARTANRPAFQEMISHAKRKDKPFEAILVWKYSRFARNREDAIIYKSLLKKHGVSVISMQEQVDDTPSGKLLEGIIEVIDEFYSANLAQDTMRGLKENASRGFQNGSYPIGYRIKKIKDGNVERSKLDIDPKYSELIKQIFNLYTEGKGIKDIAGVLNKSGYKTSKGRAWSPSAISYILKNETYTGCLIYGKHNRHKKQTPENTVRVENSHPAIISKEQFKEVQARLKRNNIQNTPLREISSEYLLSGLLTCGHCGAKVTGCNAKSGKFQYYACHNYLKRGKSVCSANYMNKKVLETVIINKIKEYVLTEENLKELLSMIFAELGRNKEKAGKELKEVEAQLQGLKERLGKLYDTLESGKIELDVIAPRIKEVKEQVDYMEMRKMELRETVNSPDVIPINVETLKYYIDDFVALLSKGSLVEQKAFLRSFIKNIKIVNRNTVVVEYTFPILKGKSKGGSSEVLSTLRFGSPIPNIARTFLLTVNVPEREKPVKLGRGADAGKSAKPCRRNPLELALAYKAMIESGQARNQADLARRLGVSRAWVTKVINTLKSV